MRVEGRIKAAVIKLTSCSGCQLQILNAEDEILEVTKRVDFTHFLELSSDVRSGPYDIAFVEGAVTTPEEVELVRSVRGSSKYVVALGACATAGGIQALRNLASTEEFKKIVYPHPEWIKTLDKVSPISEFVRVDYELRGCPVSKDRVIDFITQILAGKKPYFRREPLCMECKRKGNICVLIAKGIPCLGPVTQEGCGALCPTYGRGCYGCFGPAKDPKPEELVKALVRRSGLSKDGAVERFKYFTAWAKPFRKVVGGE